MALIQSYEYVMIVRRAQSVIDDRLSFFGTYITTINIEVHVRLGLVVPVYVIKSYGDYLRPEKGYW